jgi:hypothetical protein
MAKKLTLEVILRRFHEVHGNRYGYLNSKYEGYDVPLIITCYDHGDFPQTPDKHLSGHGCYTCGKLKQAAQFKKSDSQFILEANEVHNNRYTYGSVKYVNEHVDVIITCSDHGDFPQSPKNHLSGKGCSKCAKKLIGNLFRKSLEQFEIDSRIIHGELYDYSKFIYITNHVEGIITCRKCGRDFLKTPNAHLNLKRGCPYCNYNSSRNEKIFLDYLNIPDTFQYRQKYIKPYKVDGMRDNKIFEFLGDYWHGNPIKYSPTEYNKKVSKFHGELYNNTIKKFKSLFDRNYTIYYMWEHDYINWQKTKSLPFPIKIFNPNKPI